MEKEESPESKSSIPRKVKRIIPKNEKDDEDDKDKKSPSKKLLKKEPPQNDSESDNEDGDIKMIPKKKPLSPSPEKSTPKPKSRSRSRSKSNSSSKSKEKSPRKSEKDSKFHFTPSKKSSQSPAKSQKTSAYPSLPRNKNIKIIHWNITGLRNLLKTTELDKLLKENDPDIFCFNETKIDNSLIKNYSSLYSDKYLSYFYCPTVKKGYSGTAVFTKYTPLKVTYGINIDKCDDEGRVITLEYPDFYLICCYTPNAGEGLKRLNYRINDWDSNFFDYVNGLKEKKNIIICGDLNVAYENIDIYEPKGHNKFAGFTKEERGSFGKFLGMGYIDTFRKLHKDEKKFTYYSKRRGNLKSENKGWRLDYFVVNKGFEDNGFEIVDSDMLDKEEYNASDHIPLVFEFIIKE